MEIESIEENGHTVLVESLSPKNSLLTELSTNSGIYGEPTILPRVGDQYQAEIPSLLTAFDYLSLSNETDQVQISETNSIPLIWISEEETENKDGLRSKGQRLVPGRSEGVWSEIEESGFVFGLYVFGKNLALVKKLVGSKGMGEILSYYYGNFLGSERYKRWSECRKMKNKKCIYGERIFTGSRHQEFLSRLFINASEECRNPLMEISKAFGEGKLNLEEYIFGLEAKLGLKALVEAMAIGKGKGDLTGNLAGAQSRREIPAGKPLVALSPAEIISVLTGDIRLSKAKAGDLFWDSVWPRLLARGWHSEQPNAASNGLVYIAPGIKSFSRSELVRGLDYHDSVSDVLDLVASNPELLEIEGLNADEDRRRWCYLKPPPPIKGSKLSAVDTCAKRNDHRPRRVKELRCLPDKALDDDDDFDDDDDVSEVFDGYDCDNTVGGDIARSDGRKRRRRFPTDGSALLALPAYPVSRGKTGPTRKAGPRETKRRKRSSPPPPPQPPRQETTVSDLGANDKLSSSLLSSSSSSMSEAVDLDADVAEEYRTVEIDEVAVMGSTEEVKKSPPLDEVSVAGPTEEVSAVGPTEPPRRRQGTRNRPLTTRVLEAFAYGFMDAKQSNNNSNKKRTRASSSSSTRRARPKDADVDSSVQNGNGCDDVFNKFGE